MLHPRNAQVVELVDTLASGASDRKVVEVQVLSWAPFDSPLLPQKVQQPTDGRFAVNRSISKFYPPQTTQHTLDPPSLSADAFQSKQNPAF